MRYKHHSSYVFILILLAVLALFDDVLAQEGGPGIFVNERAVVEVPYNLKDGEAISFIPNLELRDLTQPELPEGLPALQFVGDVEVERLDRSMESKTLSYVDFPDTLLLFSDDWYGTKLRKAAVDMELEITEEQLNALESVAAVRSLNTRFLLTVAKVKDAPQEFSDTQQWLKWLYLEAAKMRAALGPFTTDDTILLSFVDGSVSRLEIDKATPAYQALITIFSAGATMEEATVDVQAFCDIYDSSFGDPTVEEAHTLTTLAPFLYKPYSVSLQGRGYFDHTYPSVDNGGTPNIGGMLDYLALGSLIFRVDLQNWL